MGAIYKLFMLQDGKCFAYNNRLYRLVNLRCGFPATVFNASEGREELMPDGVLVRPIHGIKMVAVEELPPSLVKLSPGSGKEVK